MCCVWTNRQHYIFHHNNQPFAIVIETVNEFATVEFDRTEKYFDGLKSSKCVKPAQIKQPFQPTTHNNNFHLVLMRFKLTANNHLRLKAFLAQFLNRNSYQRLLIVTKMHSMCTSLPDKSHLLLVLLCSTLNRFDPPVDTDHTHRTFRAAQSSCDRM